MTEIVVKERFSVFNINLLCYLGIWPCQGAATVWKRTLNYVMSPFVLLNLVAFYITNLIDFLRNWGNISIMTEIMCQLSADTLLIFKIIYALYKRTQFQKVIRVLENDLFIREQAINRNQESLIKNCNQQVKILTVVYICLGFCTAFFWICIPFIDQDNERNGLPFQTWTPVNISEPFYYAVAYIFHIIHALIFVLYIPAIGIFFAGTILHACGQLKLLHSSLIGLRDIVSQRIQKENQMLTFEAHAGSDTKKTFEVFHDRNNNSFKNESSYNNIKLLKRARQPPNNMTGECMDMKREMFLCLKECIVHHQTILR
jgi:hypothetical protein